MAIKEQALETCLAAEGLFVRNFRTVSTTVNKKYLWEGSLAVLGQKRAGCGRLVNLLTGKTNNLTIELRDWANANLIEDNSRVELQTDVVRFFPGIGRWSIKYAVDQISPGGYIFRRYRPRINNGNQSLIGIFKNAFEALGQKTPLVLSDKNQLSGFLEVLRRGFIANPTVVDLTNDAPRGLLMSYQLMPKRIFPTGFTDRYKDWLSLGKEGSL